MQDFHSSLSLWILKVDIRRDGAGFAFLNWCVIGRVLQKVRVTLHLVNKVFLREGKGVSKTGLMKKSNFSLLSPTQQRLGQFDMEFWRELLGICWSSLTQL